MKDLGFVLFLSAVLTHALGSLVAGSLNPADWPGLVLGVMVLFVAPLIGLGLAVLQGILR